LNEQLVWKEDVTAELRNEPEQATEDRAEAEKARVKAEGERVRAPQRFRKLSKRARQNLLRRQAKL
jgi:hypothetical protein